MAIAVGVLVVVVMVAVLLLTQLDPGGGAARAKPPARSSSSSTTVAPTTTTTAPLRAAVQYAVRQGDTLSAIARRFHVTTAGIVAVNKGLNPDKLTVGQTLTIPPEIPVRLLVKPARVAPGSTANLALSGAQPGERVTFEIQTPTGTFKGPVHVAGPDGTVNTTYAPNATDPPGSYQVVAHGDLGTNAIAALVVDAPGTP
jgi:LysM repeat protein